MEVIDVYDLLNNKRTSIFQNPDLHNFLSEIPDTERKNMEREISDLISRLVDISNRLSVVHSSIFWHLSILLLILTVQGLPSENLRFGSQTKDLLNYLYAIPLTSIIIQLIIRGVLQEEAQKIVQRSELPE